jgi:hypothetical protein
MRSFSKSTITFPSKLSQAKRKLFNKSRSSPDTGELAEGETI